MKPSSAKAKGRRLQDRVAKDHVEQLGVDEELVHKSIMGETGVDVMVLGPQSREFGDLAFECKNQESVSIWAAWEQAKANAKLVLRNPALVITRNKADVLAVLPWEMLVSYMKDRAELRRLRGETSDE